MTPQSLVITNGRLVLPSGEPAKADLRCQNGRIVALGAEAAPQDGDAVFDAGGALVAPGLVDLGVFAIDKPAFHLAASPAPR
jgi:dihydroorotase